MAKLKVDVAERELVDLISLAKSNVVISRAASIDTFSRVYHQDRIDQFKGSICMQRQTVGAWKLKLAQATRDLEIAEGKEAERLKQEAAAAAAAEVAAKAAAAAAAKVAAAAKKAKAASVVAKAAAVAFEQGVQDVLEEELALAREELVREDEAKARARARVAADQKAAKARAEAISSADWIPDIED